MASVFGLSACNTASEVPSTKANASEPTATQNQATAQEKVKAKGVWIDVRTPEEFGAGHLKDSLNVPVEDIGAKIASIEPDKNAPINLYCRSGRRAETARQTLLGMGYTNVTNHGGYDDLIKQGYR